MRGFFPSTQTFYTLLHILCCDNMSRNIELIVYTEHYAQTGIYVRDSMNLRECYELVKDYEVGGEPVIQIRIDRSDFEEED